MKKLFFAAMTCAVAFLACTKQQQDVAANPASREKFAVRFEVSEFKKDVSELPDGARKTSPSGRDMNFVNRFSHLYYFVFDGENKVREILQEKSVAGDAFGEITDSLPEGNYGFLFVAAPGPLNISSATKSGTFLQLPSDANGRMDPFNNHAYFHYVPLNVAAGTNAPIDISVKRTFSFLQVNVEDTEVLESEGNIIVATLRNANDKFNFYNQHAGDGTRSVELMRAGNFHGTQVFRPSGANYELKIVATNMFTQVVSYSKTISGIQFSPNQQITYSGELKSSPTGPGNESKFSLSVSDLYDADTTIHF